MFEGSHHFTPESQNLFNFLKAKDKTPINIDLKKPKDVNVSRGLKGAYDISDIKSGADLKTIRIKFGHRVGGEPCEEEAKIDKLFRIHKVSDVQRTDQGTLMYKISFLVKRKFSSDEIKRRV
mgnify:CR=1 FL=1